MQDAVTQIGYVGINSTDLTGWKQLGVDMGVEFTDLPDGIAMRIDNDRHSRVNVHASERDGLAYAGWQVSGPDAFEHTLKRLQDSGAAPEVRQDLARARGTAALATFTDPDGNPGEIYWGASTAMRTQFISPHGVEFSVGHMGMGHLTIAVQDFTRTMEFYTQVLGMQLTEIADVGAGKVGFLRCNPRHHTLAFAQVPPNVPSMILHLAIEVTELDMLGSIRDRMLDGGSTIHRDLGRHPTDGVISMYTKPAGAAFEVELGWGSTEVEDDTWETERYRRVGWSWGHRATNGSTARLGEDATN